MVARAQRFPVGNVTLRSFEAADFNGLEEQIAEAADRLDATEMILDRRHLKGLTARQGVVAEFILDHIFENGRERSRRQVRFGNLLLETPFDQRTQNFIALKPFAPNVDLRGRTPAQALAHEWVANERVAALSPSRWTFEPVGIWKVSKADVPQLITKFESPVTTADNIFWVPENKAEDVGDAQIKSALQRGFYSLGLLHAAGYAHGDAQVKNIGRDPERIRFIDLEWLKILGISNHVVEPTEDNADAVHGDLHVFIRSTIDTRQTDNAMLHRVAPLVVGADPVALHKAYVTGAKEGSRLSGNTLAHELVYTPRKLHDVIQTNLAFQAVLNQEFRGGSVFG